jgi:DNA-binding MarR family transcriptional regulator
MRPGTGGADPPIGVLEQIAGYHLRRAFGAMATDFAVAMDGTGLRQVLFAILAVVSSNPGANQGMVGRLLGIKRANMVALINELVERGLLNRLADPQDRRAFALTVTPDGYAVLEEGLARIRKHEDRMLSGFSANERKMLIRLLKRIEARAGLPE